MVQHLYLVETYQYISYLLTVMKMLQTSTTANFYLLVNTGSVFRFYIFYCTYHAYFWNRTVSRLVWVSFSENSVCNSSALLAISGTTCVTWLKWCEALCVPAFRQHQTKTYWRYLNLSGCVYWTLIFCFWFLRWMCWNAMYNFSAEKLVRFNSKWSPN